MRSILKKQTLAESERVTAEIFTLIWYFIKTYIEVDEQGTKAGAATVVGIAEYASLETPVVKTVHLDRPFVYAIIDNETQMPLFLGVTETITQ